MVTIGFYGRLAETFGREIEIELPDGGATVAELRARFAELDPAGVRALLNDETAGEEARVGPGDRLDFLPPLSGG
jgi:molybdopterin converting factor small subunit